MKKLRRMLLTMLLSVIWPTLLDHTMEGGPEPEFNPDEFVRRMNKFMPLKDEIVVLGFKAPFKEIKILKNYGRDEQHVKECEPEPDGEEFRWMFRDAEEVADSYPYYHILILDIFCASCCNLPIAPSALHVIMLSVDPNTGELNILDKRRMGKTGCTEGSEFMRPVIDANPGYDYYTVARVIGHAWND